MQLGKAKRLVVKVGSSILIGEDGILRNGWLDAFAEEVVAFSTAGMQVIVVTSGAVALGRAALGIRTGRSSWKRSRPQPPAGRLC